MSSKKVLLSGIQPSGELHIGNYFGAMRQFVALQDEYDTYISIVNFHALTTVQDPKKLSENTLNAAIDHLAIGLKPGILFLQSDVPEVTELAWIFETLITVPYLSRAHAYKDKVTKGIEPTAGLFNYPALMAADILIQNADVVPVGSDQKQHLEYARDIALKFNNAFGETLKLPEALILEDVAVVPGIDGEKMSKSYNNTVPLFATDEEIEKNVMSIVTDSKSPEEPKDSEKDVTFQLHKLFADEKTLADIQRGYEEGGLSYAESKKMLSEEIKAFIAPFRKRREEIAKDRSAIINVLRDGAARARERACETMHAVRGKVGLTVTI